MESKATYYNEEYSPISDDYREAEERAAQTNHQERTIQRENTGQKRQSRYDENDYALPDTDDEDSPSTSTPPVKTERQPFMWMGIAISSIILIVVLGIVMMKNHGRFSSNP